MICANPLNENEINGVIKLSFEQLVNKNPGLGDVDYIQLVTNAIIDKGLKGERKIDIYDKYYLAVALEQLNNDIDDIELKLNRGFLISLIHHPREAKEMVTVAQLLNLNDALTHKRVTQITNTPSAVGEVYDAYRQEQRSLKYGSHDPRSAHGYFRENRKFKKVVVDSYDTLLNRLTLHK